MCELYGISNSTPGKAVSGLHRFAEHSCRNPHGWGIAFYRDGEAILAKMPEKALASKTYYQLAESVESDVIISHIRKASLGEKHERNCHPFTHHLDGRNWVFAHNGHVDGITQHPRAKGETDSESVFHMLLDHLRGSVDTVTGLQQGITSLFEEYEFGRQIRLNFLLSDGVNLYAFSHHSEKPMYHQNGNCWQGAQTLVSTQTLGSMPWEKLPEDHLMSIAKGQIQSITGPI